MNSPDLCNTLSDSETEQCIKDIFDMVDTALEVTGHEEGSFTAEDYKKRILKEIQKALDMYEREGKIIRERDRVIALVGKKIRQKYIATANTLTYRYELIYNELIKKGMINDEVFCKLRELRGMKKKIDLLLGYERFKNNFDSLAPGITQE